MRECETPTRLSGWCVTEYLHPILLPTQHLASDARGFDAAREGGQTMVAGASRSRMQHAVVAVMRPVCACRQVLRTQPLHAVALDAAGRGSHEARQRMPPSFEDPTAAVGPGYRAAGQS